ncbi:MAG: hypothetical protein QF415_01300 [Candidatus Undinarchaeales archaeon]|jgi:hypothetical protein|nr:hypothetical protein [Candidatus Undinarchaeales archaeon]MDP7493288.1 hypothetical protein [Candidatus Undinarchaeales archaeon]
MLSYVLGVMKDFFHFFMPAQGHEFETRSTAYPPWAKELWRYVRRDIAKVQFSRLIAETKAFKRFIGWKKAHLAAEHLGRMADILRGKDQYNIDKFEDLTGIPIHRVVDTPEEASTLSVEIIAGEVKMKIRPERIHTRDAKAELEERWKERLWDRFQKNTSMVFENLKENDLFHAESFMMDIVFQYDGLQPERREFIKTSYLDKYGIDLERMLELKADEREQLKQFIRLIKEKKEMDAMLDETFEMMDGPDDGTAPEEGHQD